MTRQAKVSAPVAGKLDKSSSSVVLIVRGTKVSGGKSQFSLFIPLSQAPGVGDRCVHWFGVTDPVHKRQTQSKAGPTPVSTKVNGATVYLEVLQKNHGKPVTSFLP